MERRAEVAGLLAQLKPAERDALILLGLGYPYKEIAEIQGWTRTKVNRCLTEGRAALRRTSAGGGVKIMKPTSYCDMEINDQTHFLGCGFEGTLEMVQTLPPDHAAIRIMLSGRSSLFLDPVETQVFACGELSPGSTCLEFRCGACTVATLETA